MKASKTLIRVINEETRSSYYVYAKMVKDYNATPTTETVAWFGTLQLYESKGRYFLQWHNGSQDTMPAAYEVSKDALNWNLETAKSMI